MRKTILSKLIFMSLFLSFVGVNSYAEEVVLCMSHADQYVVTVNEKGDCLENENQIVISRSDIAQKKGMTPVANFMENKDCDGEGTKTEIGFDENGNGELDTNEIVSTTGTCTPLVLAEEESAEPAE